MSELSERRCAEVPRGTPPLEGDALRELGESVPKWEIVGGKQIRRSFSFPDFATALAFTNRVGEIAETAGHHPDIELSWGKVVVTLWTHTVGGLSENDFIEAARIDELDASAAGS